MALVLSIRFVGAGSPKTLPLCDNLTKPAPAASREFIILSLTEQYCYRNRQGITFPKYYNYSILG